MKLYFSLTIIKLLTCFTFITYRIFGILFINFSIWFFSFRMCVCSRTRPQKLRTLNIQQNFDISIKFRAVFPLNLNLLNRFLKLGGLMTHVYLKAPWQRSWEGCWKYKGLVRELTFSRAEYFLFEYSCIRTDIELTKGIRFSVQTLLLMKNYFSDSFSVFILNCWLFTWEIHSKFHLLESSNSILRIKIFTKSLIYFHIFSKHKIMIITIWTMIHI